MMTSERVINALDYMIDNMTTERERYVGRIRQLDDDIDRLNVFKSSLQREAENHENNDQDTVRCSL